MQKGTLKIEMIGFIRFGMNYNLSKLLKFEPVASTITIPAPISSPIIILTFRYECHEEGKYAFPSNAHFESVYMGRLCIH